jgi:hypothetical protein
LKPLSRLAFDDADLAVNHEHQEQHSQPSQTAAVRWYLPTSKNTPA